MQWQALGYGTRGEIIAELRDDLRELGSGAWILIRDDDAAITGAPSCWFATRGADIDAAIADHQSIGGTCSAVYVIT